MAENVEGRVAFENWARHGQTLEAVMRSKESAATILMGKANGPNGERYQEMAEQAMQDIEDARNEYDEHMQNPPDAFDPEGTKPTMSDSKGNFARNQRVANAGGIGVKGSNSVEGSDEPADDPEDAGELDESVLMPPVVMGRGGRPESITGQRVVIHPDDVQEEEENGAEGDEEGGATKARGRSRSRRKARASSRRRASDSEE